MHQRKFPVNHQVRTERLRLLVYVAAVCLLGMAACGESSSTTEGSLVGESSSTEEGPSGPLGWESLADAVDTPEDELNPKGCSAISVEAIASNYPELGQSRPFVHEPNAGESTCEWMNPSAFQVDLRVLLDLDGSGCTFQAGQLLEGKIAQSKSYQGTVKAHGFDADQTLVCVTIEDIARDDQDAAVSLLKGAAESLGLTLVSPTSTGDVEIVE